MFAQLAKPAAKRSAAAAVEGEEACAISSASAAAARSSWRPSASQPAAAASWKRVKTEPVDAAAAMTQPSAAVRKPMLGAWFGAARAAAANQQSQPASQSTTPQLSAVARVKVEATTTTSLSQDSEDDKPLAHVALAKSQPPQLQQHTKHQQQQQQRHVESLDWKQQKQLQRVQARAAAVGTGFKTAREAARDTEAHSAAATSVMQRGVATTTPAAAAAAAATRVASSEDARVFLLSTKRRVTVRRWKSAVLVDIREYYDDNGVSKPGKKGISLAMDQWSTLTRMANVIDDAVALVEEDRVDGYSLGHVKERIPVNEERIIAFTLSSKRRITIRFFRSAVLIDLREYYEDGNVMKPGKKGISLSKDQWRSLLQTEAEISQAIQEV